MTSEQLPVIDFSSFLLGKNLESVAAAIGKACRDKGFFYITGHGVDPRLEADLERLSQTFFALPGAEKMTLAMELAGPAWRGFFPLGGELTSGKPDWKEGLYFGEEHADTHPLVLTRTALHGKNLFPALPNFRETVLRKRNFWQKGKG